MHLVLNGRHIISIKTLYYTKFNSKLMAALPKKKAMASRVTIGTSAFCLKFPSSRKAGSEAALGNRTD